MGISNMGLKIWPKVALWAFLRMCTKSGQTGPKRGKKIAKKSGSVRNSGQRT